MSFPLKTRPLHQQASSEQSQEGMITQGVILSEYNVGTLVLLVNDPQTRLWGLPTSRLVRPGELASHVLTREIFVNLKIAIDPVKWYVCGHILMPRQGFTHPVDRAVYSYTLPWAERAVLTVDHPGPYTWFDVNLLPDLSLPDRAMIFLASHDKDQRFFMNLVQYAPKSSRSLDKSSKDTESTETTAE